LVQSRGFVMCKYVNILYTLETGTEKCLFHSGKGSSSGNVSRIGAAGWAKFKES